MYSFKTMIYNLLEDNKNNQEDTKSCISFYKAYAISLSIKDLKEKTDSTQNINTRNKIIKSYLEDPTPQKTTTLLNQIGKDQKIIMEILDMIREYEEETSYTEENIDLRHIKGCIGTVIEGY